MENRKKNIIMKLALGMFLAGLCIPLDSIDVFVSDVRNPQVMGDAQYFWMNSIIYGGIYGGYFINAIAALSYADSFCQEYQNGIWRYIIARTGNLKYAITNLGCAFLCGGITLCGGGFLFLLSTSGVCTLFDAGRYQEIVFLPFGSLLAENPKLYFAAMLYLLFLAGGLWSCVSYCFSVYVPITYLTYLVPFVISFVLTRLFVILQIPAQWRIDFMLSGRSGPENSLVYLLVISGVVFCLVCCCVHLFYKKLKWRMENE